MYDREKDAFFISGNHSEEFEDAFWEKALNSFCDAGYVLRDAVFCDFVAPGFPWRCLGGVVLLKVSYLDQITQSYPRCCTRLPHIVSTDLHRP